MLKAIFLVILTRSCYLFYTLYYIARFLPDARGRYWVSCEMMQKVLSEMCGNSKWRREQKQRCSATARYLSCLSLSYKHFTKNKNISKILILVSLLIFAYYLYSYLFPNYVSCIMRFIFFIIFRSKYFRSKYLKHICQHRYVYTVPVKRLDTPSHLMCPLFS